jgi:SagB-type dehydrogenase family enzyme
MNSLSLRLVAVFVAWSTLAPLTSWSAEGDIKLPKPSFTGKVSVEEALSRARTARQFTSAPITLAQASQILWAANGVLPADAVSGATMKVSPSAGGLYPIEVFLVVGENTVTGVPAGVYVYSSRGNALREVCPGDKRDEVARASAGGNQWLAQAPALIIIGGVFQRTMQRYGPQGQFYVLMEAGNANQNICLQVSGLDLRAGTVGAFNAGQLSKATKMPAEVTPLLIVAVGK